MITRRARRIKPFLVMDILEKAGEMDARGEDVVHLEVGEPDFATPAPVTEAAVRALREGNTRYTHSMGLPALREAIADRYRMRYGVEVSADRVLVTAGTSPAMLLLFSLLIERGDRVVMTDPHYASYPHDVGFFGGDPAFVRVREGDGFLPDPAEMKRRVSRRTRAVLVNSPANPTGAVLDAERMEAIAALGPPVVSDEIYHGLVYEGREHSILEFTDRACVINGFSKLYAMTGWRLGYLIVPKAWARPLQKIHQNFFISANAFVQHAALAALTDPAVERAVEGMRRAFEERRHAMVEGLRGLGFGVSRPPGGAFYVFAGAKKFGRNSLALSRDLLTNARVAAAPGVDFGRGGEGYLRFSYAASLERIAEGMLRLGRYLGNNRPGGG